MKIEEILQKIGKDVLTDDTKKMIAEAFTAEAEKIADEKAKKRAELEVQNALLRLDEEHATKLEQILEAIDKDHTTKLNAVLEKIDSQHSGMLKNVIKKYEGLLKEEAIKFRDSMVDEISNYMDLYLEKAVPKDQIAKAAQNTRSRKMVEQMKRILSVDEAYVTENIKEALSDGKQTIETIQKELNETIKENISLAQQLKVTGAKLVLEKKTANLPKEKKNYVMRILAEKAPEYIEENFDYVVEMFAREQTEKTELIKEKAEQSVVSKNIDQPQKPIQESNEQTFDNDGNPVNDYITEMQRFDQKNSRK